MRLGQRRHIFDIDREHSSELSFPIFFQMERQWLRAIVNKRKQNAKQSFLAQSVSSDDFFFLFISFLFERKSAHILHDSIK